MSHQSTYDQFQSLDIRVGTIVHAEVFAEAKKPAFKLSIDFGQELGHLKSSAQITDNYSPESLIGTQIIAVINFPKKQIGPFLSECLVLGVMDAQNKVILLRPDGLVTDGCKIA